MMTVMRYPSSHREEMRAKIVRAAAAALRREGFDGISIPALMSRVGLTHGGFYNYFRDRDALVAEAISAAGNATAAGAFAKGLSLEETLRRYLSTGHIEHPEDGCVVAALGSDGRRQSPVVRGAFATVAKGLLRLVDQKLGAASDAAPTDAALKLTATMVGAVILGRLVDDEALAKRILRAASA